MNFIAFKVQFSKIWRFRDTIGDNYYIWLKSSAYLTQFFVQFWNFGQQFDFFKCPNSKNFTILSSISNHISKFRQNRNKNGITRWCTGYDQLLGGDETDVFDRRKKDLWLFCSKLLIFEFVRVIFGQWIWVFGLKIFFRSLNRYSLDPRPVDSIQLTSFLV